MPGQGAPLLLEEGSGGGADFGWAVAKNERKKMEDAVDVQEDVAGYRMFAVYDGHAGDEAVSIIKKILPGILGAHLDEEPNVERAICQAFRDTDQELTKTVLAAAPKPTT